MAEEINKAGAESSGKKKGRYRQRRMLAVLLVLVFVWWFNNYTLRTANLTVYSDKVSRGFRIAVISDLHASSHGISNRRIVRRINKSSPDMVAILGDMYTSGSTEDVIQIRWTSPPTLSVRGILCTSSAASMTMTMTT